MLLPFPCVETPFVFESGAITLLVPDPQALHARHMPGGSAAPYWARIWPAALGLCRFLEQVPEIAAGKRVLELAAGLGLPGLLAAQSAAQVTLSDIDPQAVIIQHAAAERNGFTNVDARVIDWNAIPAELRPELVLLSDVNYDPALFDGLFLALIALLDAGASIVLSSPQRLMAKPFIERLLPHVTRQEEISVGDAFVSLFVLK